MSAMEELEAKASLAKEAYEAKCKARTVAQKAHIRLITEAKTAFTTWEELETALLALLIQQNYQPELILVEGGDD